MTERRGHDKKKIGEKLIEYRGGRKRSGIVPIAKTNEELQ